MTPSFSKDLDHQIRGTVYDPGLRDKPWRRVNEAHEFYDLYDPIKVTLECLSSLRQNRETAEPSKSLGFFDFEVFTQSANLD